MPQKSRSLFLALAFVLLVPGAVLADQIDGHWCFTDGRSFTVKGPQIITPGGNKLTGKYDRHGFEYTVPVGEPGADGTVTMVQQNDRIIHVLWPGLKKP